MISKKILGIVLSTVISLSILAVPTISYADTTSNWYQNFESGTGFTAGTNTSVTSDASSANSGGAKSVKMTFGTSADPGTTSNCVKITPQNGSSIDASSSNYLMFSVKDTQGANTIKVTFVDTNNATWSGWTSAKSVQNQWTKIAFPLSSVSGIDKSKIKEIRIGEWNSGIYYFDDLYLATNTTDDAPSFSTSPSDPTSLKIEAENYTSMNGVTPETCTEGGSDVGYIDSGDWMDYTVNVPSSGTYTMNFRVSGSNPGGSLQLQKNGTILGIIVPPNTGGWQNWTTVSTKVSLTAGTQTLRVYSTGSSVNLNWFSLTPTTTTTKPNVIGYIPDWDFDYYKTVDLSILTHICIAFANPDSSGNLSVGVSDADINACVARAHAANVKVLLSLGGASGSPNYKNLIQPQNCGAFSDKIVQYMNKYKLDGIDVDLEENSYQNLDLNWGGFIDALSSRLKPQGKLLSSAVAKWEDDDNTNYFPDASVKKLDLVNLMAYGSYQEAIDNLNCFVNKGVDRNKLVLGVPFFGNSSSGEIAYKDIISEYPDAWNVDSYAGISYVGAATMAKETQIGNGFGGVMIWDMSEDASGDKSLLKVIGNNTK